MTATTTYTYTTEQLQTLADAARVKITVASLSPTDQDTLAQNLIEARIGGRAFPLGRLFKSIIKDAVRVLTVGGGAGSLFLLNIVNKQFSVAPYANTVVIGADVAAVTASLDAVMGGMVTPGFDQLKAAVLSDVSGPIALSNGISARMLFAYNSGPKWDGSATPEGAGPTSLMLITLVHPGKTAQQAVDIAAADYTHMIVKKAGVTVETIPLAGWNVDVAGTANVLWMDVTSSVRGWVAELVATPSTFTFTLG